MPRISSTRTCAAIASFFAVSIIVGGCVASPPIQGGGAASVAESSSYDQAKQSGADPSQLAILEKGEVSFSDYEAAVQRTLTCMQQAGIDVIAPVVNDRTGIKILAYSWSPNVAGLSEDQVTALGDDCLNRYSMFVEGEWQMQPSSLEAKEKHFDRFRPAVLACIRKHGGTVADDAKREEALTAAFSVMDSTGINCFTEAGIE